MAERLREQINPQHLPLSTRRASAIHATQTGAHPPASPHYAGHEAGLHGEDVPYTTRVRPRRPLSPPPHEDEEDDEDARYDRRPPRSAIRYTSETVPRSHKTRVVYAPARETVRLRGGPRFHWLFWMGLALLVMVAGFVALSALGSWWQVQQGDWHYGRPRTFQIDAVVGHNGDTAATPSHFIAVNLNRKIIVIELPAGDSAQAHIYLGPTLLGDGQDLTPVTLSFEDRNGDGKPDLNIHIGDQVIVFLNNGKQFVAPQLH